MGRCSGYTIHILNKNRLGASKGEKWPVLGLFLDSGEKAYYLFVAEGVGGGNVAETWQAEIYGKEGSEATRFYASPGWLRISKACKARDGYRCQVNRCDVHGAAKVQAHHIAPRAGGGADELWNLITLCRKHHDAAENDPGRFNTKRAIRVMLGERPRKRTMPTPNPGRGCPYHPGVVCWHMVVYGSYSRDHENMTFQEYDARGSDE